MSFQEELESVLPADIPHRTVVIQKAGMHLEWIVKANREFNLTRIENPRDAAIKHVLDSVLPWKHFADQPFVLDAGTGAGYPGIPLALALSDTRFTLCDSVGKKARFAGEIAKALGLTNVTVVNRRAEEYLREGDPQLITGRALAPLAKACALFGPAIRSGSKAILYKGANARAEMAEAEPEANKQRLRLRLSQEFELPDSLGTRALVEIESGKEASPI